MRQTDLVDGLQSTADNLDKVLAIMSDLLIRVRQLEGVMLEEDKPSSGGGCGLNCANNSFTL